MQQDNKPTVTIIMTLVVALIIGGGLGYMIGNNNNGGENTQPTTSSSVRAVESPAADTRVALNNALREHVSLSSVALRAAFNGDANTEAALGTLDENSKEVAGLVGSVYGEEAEEQFLSLWRAHIGFFADYTVAAKAGDQAGMDQALEDLAGYSQDAAVFFSSANENLPADTVKQLLEHHRDHVISVVNAWGAGDFARSYEEEQAAREQVGKIGDALASGIVKQSPDKFSSN